MRMQKLFTHKNLELTLEDIPSVTNENGTRYYESPNGRYPSVTTVVGWEKNQLFKGWRQRNPKECKRVLRRGNELHQIIEDYLNNKKLDLLTHSPVVSSLFVQMKDYLDNIDNIYALEVPLWSDILGLAGRVDCIAEYNGTLSVIDFKGSTREKKIEDIENYLLQGTAYAIMWHERTGTPIREFNIIVSSENGKPCEVFSGNPIKYVPRLYEVIKDYDEEWLTTTEKTNI